MGQPGGLYSRSNTPKLSLAQGPSSFLQDTQQQSGQKIIIFFPHFQVINSNNFLSGSSLLPSRLKRVSCKVWLTSLSSGRQKNTNAEGKGHGRATEHTELCFQLELLWLPLPSIQAG